MPILTTPSEMLAPPAAGFAGCENAGLASEPVSAAPIRIDKILRFIMTPPVAKVCD
jgi:hypothetical protein